MPARTTTTMTIYRLVLLPLLRALLPVPALLLVLRWLVRGRLRLPLLLVRALRLRLLLLRVRRFSVLLLPLLLLPLLSSFAVPASASARSAILITHVSPA